MLEPIGYFRTSKIYPYDAASQASYDIGDSIGCIEVTPAFCLPEEICNARYLLVTFQFHQKQSWKPMLIPPRGHPTKLGVFATRSPYRPNSLGLSVLSLLQVRQQSLIVGKHDLLDQTPILQLQEYQYEHHCRSMANQGWIKAPSYQVRFSHKVEKQLLFLSSFIPHIKNFIIQQLGTNPFDGQRKRLKKLSELSYELSYRTWRISCRLNKNNTFEVEEIFSGYSKDELNLLSDRYGDKGFHRQFALWSSKM